MKSFNIQKVFIYFILILFLFVELFPLYYLVVNVFKTEVEFSINQFSLPNSLYLGNFMQAWVEGHFLEAFKNSIILTGFGTFGRIFFGSLAAYAIATMKFKGNKIAYNLLIGSMFLPPIVVIIPLFKMMIGFGLINNYLAPILIYIGYLPFTAYVLTAFFKTVPVELLDSARIDGCGDFRIYYSIILPLSKPALASMAILNVRSIWNNFLIPLIFLNKEEYYTLMVRIVNFQGRFVTHMTTMLTGLFISIIPIFLLFIFFQRYFTKGMTLGSFK